jgi:hypothetical protein
MLKSWTLTVAGTVCTVEPLVPEIVNAYEPGTAAPVEVRVSVDVPEPVMLAGLKLAETTFGPENPVLNVRSKLTVKVFVEVCWLDPDAERVHWELESGAPTPRRLELHDVPASLSK